jgi:asparagine synthase (glutamine-hydrolysing)
MCGIAGFVGRGGPADLHAMNAAHALRGPDGAGAWIDPETRVHLAQTRLAVIDIAGGEQPMWNEDGQVGVVFNGEIYNHVELRKELLACGHRFKSDHSDTEVLVHGYEEWGENLPLKLNGMFAFAIIDRPRRRLFAARDRFGKKPFYYYDGPGLFAFASQLNGLFEHREVPRAIDPTALHKYFGYGFIPAPRSLYRDIRKLPGGYALSLDLDTSRSAIRQYWKFAIEPFDSIPANAEQRWCEQLRELLSQAVKRRLVSDVPLGIFLSGGIDSTAVLAFAAKHRPARQNRTFSIGFSEPSFDESAFALQAAQAFDSDHHQQQLDLDAAVALIPGILAQLDEPMADASIIPTWLLSRFARESVTVALGGDGGDELFAGYDPFKAIGVAQTYQRFVPKPMHAGIRALFALLPASERNLSLEFKLKRGLRGLSYPESARHPAWLGALEPNEISALFHQRVSTEDVYSEAIEAWEQSRATHPVDRSLEFYTRFYLQDDILTKVDRASMMVSLEVRAPFLDNDLADFARQIPHDYKCRNGETKYLLKKALEPVLPHAIIYRKKKGFGVPLTRWLKHMPEPENLLKSPAPDLTWVQRQWAEHRAGKADHRLFLWSWMVLQAHLGQR